jgi:hypothetical protein
MSLQVGDEAWATEPDNHFALVKLVEDKGESFLATPCEHAEGGAGGSSSASEPKSYKKNLLYSTNPKFMDGVEDMIDLSHLHEVCCGRRVAQFIYHACNHRVAGRAAAQC